MERRPPYNTIFAICNREIVIEEESVSFMHRITLLERRLFLEVTQIGSKHTSPVHQGVIEVIKATIDQELGVLPL